MYHDPFRRTDFMFTLGPIMFTILSMLFIGLFAVIIIGGIKEWNKNNHSPVLIVEAVLVGKRINVSHSHHDHGESNISHSSSSSSYYVTFEVESGDRMEFHVTGQEYGLLVEGDKGKLTFQGTRYKAFERVRG